MPAKTYNLSEFRERRITEASVMVELPDGDPIAVPPPDCYPDKLPRGGRALFDAIIGESEVQRFIDAGGTLRMLDKIIEDANGVDTGN